jgi:hypothetical protein
MNVQISLFPFQNKMAQWINIYSIGSLLPSREDNIPIGANVIYLVYKVVRT